MAAARSAELEHGPGNLEELLEALSTAPNGGEDEVALRDVVEAIGRRSFGPLLLVAGLLAVSPLAAIPGMPTTLGLLVASIAVQLLLRRERFWLPGWLLRRRLSRKKFCKTVSWMRKPARFVDRFLKARLEVVTRHAGLYGIALLCSLIGLLMPSLEIVPFSAHVAGLALTAFGLALIAHDGLVGLVALLITGGAAAFVIVQLFF